jgi:FAD/FMN-containing dehydrogenase
MRELTLGLEVVLPDGRIWDGLRSLRKDNTGYDLKQLFIGAEGTLGIITAAVLKLFPLPRFRSTAFVAIGSLEAALDLLSRLRQDADDTLTTLEMIPSVALELSVSHVASCSRPLEGQHDYYLLIELAGGKTEADLRTDLESILERALSDGLIEDAVIAQSTSDAARLWAIREGIVEAQRHLGASIKHDVAVPVSAVPEFFRHASSLVQARLPGIIVYAFGHLGDGNLHFNLIQPGEMDASDFLARTGDFNRCIHDVVHRYGGTISAEHGIGQLRREEMPRYKSAQELELMRVVKNALDPDGRMNPGKLLRAD